MSDVMEAKRARDRRPEEVPHHPKAMTTAWVLSGVAFVLMVAWFWSVNTGQGFILTAEQQNAAQREAAEQAEAEAQAEADQTQSDLDRAAEATQPDQNPGGSKGGPPEAPDASDTVTDQMELTNWSILSVNGVLNVGGTLKNTSAVPLSGTVKVYVYIDAVPVAVAKTEIKNLQPQDSERVNLVSDADWEPGEKVVLLTFQPRK